MNKTIYNKEEKIIGYTSYNVYYSPRNKNHFMKRFQGFGISDYILKELFEKDIEIVCILYEGEKGIQKYVCSLNKFIKSEKIHFFNLDDEQKFVSIGEFNNGE
jgi:hypothetical protein